MFWETISIIATVLGSGYYIHRELKADHKEFKEDLRIQASRVDAVNARLDSLYTMFYDLLKEMNKRV